MRVVTVKAIAKELYERGHYLDEDGIIRIGATVKG